MAEDNPTPSINPQAPDDTPPDTPLEDDVVLGDPHQDDDMPPEPLENDAY